MEYYSKLNMEVEKSKIHTEWKIKRLQLDQSRIQLLSTEERNLKREKLELEHKKNEEIMAMSIQSLETKSDDEPDANDDNETSTAENKMTESTSSNMFEAGDSEFEINKDKSKTSSDVFSAICNVAKSIFGVSRTNETEKVCDNEKDLDTQGNVVVVDVENNTKTSKTSSDVIGGHLNDAFDNLQYMEMREKALHNKQKVMTHEFGQIDNENNKLTDPPLLNMRSTDEENNVKDSWTPFVEAKRNRLKVLGTEFATLQSEGKQTLKFPKTEAQKQALINKQKVLGVEYNLPSEITVIKEPANIAQEEALRNRLKVLGSEDVLPTVGSKRDAKRSGLTLNLKPYNEMLPATSSNGVTPNTGAVTPGEFYLKVSSILYCKVTDFIVRYNFTRIFV